MTDRIYPQFATHNAHTVAAILSMADNRDTFEFQRLHGMGEALHETVRQAEGTRCRIYAPVGAHSDLLAYLVRRLLENGANSSFVHQLTDEDVEPEDIARDPLETVENQGPAANPAIARPSRRSSAPAAAIRRGSTSPITVTLAAIDKAKAAFAGPERWHAKPITRAAGYGKQRPVVNPAKPAEVVGTVSEAAAKQVATAVRFAVEAQPAWAKRRSPSAPPSSTAPPISTRPMPSSSSRWPPARPASRWPTASPKCARPSTSCATTLPKRPTTKPGTQARGAIVCISPWNFPLAIFTGQIAAALVTGNSVIAKPAEQTPLIAFRAVELLREAGVPEDVIQLLPGDGPSVGGPLTADPRIAGVCFTGSTEVAKLIEKQLAETAAPDAMLIAETGGLNAMIVDSTALPEQAVRDILASAFQSAGQRCSALRVLYVQKDVEKKMLEMLKGAMEALNVGDPWQISTDVGPVIDDEAQSSIRDYCTKMGLQGRLIAKLEAPKDGRFVAPHVFRVKGIEEMEREVFGPVLHVASFDADEIDAVIAAINRKGYGLTFGLHTRIEGRVQHFVDGIHAGNIYVNRNQIGAVVGSQPFGGEGLSGTGPKAGGPHYLRRFRKGPEAGTRCRRRPQGDGDRARRQSARSDAWRLVDAAGPHRHPEKASARQGRCGHRRRRCNRFRPGRPARTDRRGQHAVAVAARPGAVPRPGCRHAACPDDPGARRRQCGAGRRAGRAGGTVGADRQGPAAGGHRRPARSGRGALAARRCRRLFGHSRKPRASCARSSPTGPARSCRWSAKCSTRRPMRMNAPSASTPRRPAAMPACWRRRKDFRTSLACVELPGINMGGNSSGRADQMEDKSPPFELPRVAVVITCYNYRPYVERGDPFGVGADLPELGLRHRRRCLDRRLGRPCPSASGRHRRPAPAPAGSAQKMAGRSRAFAMALPRPMRLSWHFSMPTMSGCRIFSSRICRPTSTRRIRPRCRVPMFSWSMAATPC